jgi:thioredoxin reductase (NADPH)
VAGDQPQKDDDRDRNANEPKTSRAHEFFLPRCVKKQRRSPSGVPGYGIWGETMVIHSAVKQGGTVRDCLIIGGGPAGLTAAIYLARFRLSCALIDSEKSRAALIPVSHNFPGHPAGIAGRELLGRLRQQLQTYGISPLNDVVTSVQRTGQSMRATTVKGVVGARTILLATGKEDTSPVFEDGNHDEAVRRGLLHYCPICDAYEISGKPVVVLGSGEHGVKEALFLRRYTSDVELVCPSGDHRLNDNDREWASRADIRLTNGPLSSLRIIENRLAFKVGPEPREAADIYVALGCRQRSELARAAGAALADDGCIIVDAHQRTTVSGLYGAGDVVVGLDQVTTAVGHAAIAATAIRNDLLGF